MRVFRWWFAPFCVALVASAGASEELSDPPCLPVAGSPLAALVGEWQVEWRYRVAPEEYETTEAGATISVDLAGCAVVERFSGRLRGAPYSALTIISQIDTETFDRVRADSEHGAFTQSTGELVDGALVFHWERALPNRTLRTRHEYRVIDSGELEVAFYMSPRDGADWALVNHARYRPAPTTDLQ